jgi:hypothetical protein
MRNNNLRIVEDEISCVKDVEVNVSRRVSGSLRRTPHCFFNLQYPVQQRDRWSTEIDLDYRVEIEGGAGLAVDWVGFVDGRDSYRRSRLVERTSASEATAKVLQSIFDV